MQDKISWDGITMKMEYTPSNQDIGLQHTWQTYGDLELKHKIWKTKGPLTENKTFCLEVGFEMFCNMNKFKEETCYTRCNM